MMYLYSIPLSLSHYKLNWRIRVIYLLFLNNPITGGNNLVINNNIFANNGGGFAVGKQGSPLITSFDYNNFFSGSNRLGLISSEIISQFDSLIVLLGENQNSLI